MKQTEFNAMSNVTTQAAALLLSNGVKFFFNETQIFQNGDMPSSKIGKKNNAQQKRTSLRHKIHYYVRDTSHTQGYYQAFDILESDVATQESKTTTRVGKTRVAARDDDDGRDVIASPDWS
jgi:hypothetical protein